MRMKARIAGCALTAAAALAAASPARAGEPPKLVLVLFGGGTRCSETVDDARHRFVPRLAGELIPRGTLFTDMRVEGPVVHPNAAASIVTGRREWDDLDWSRPVAHPTVFEVCRKARGTPD